MRKRIGVMKGVLVGAGLGLGLGLPLLSAVGGHLILSGHADAISAPAVASGLATRPAIRVGGDLLPNAGVPCRRSAGDGAARDTGRKSGCNLRLVKRRPGDAMIWV